MEQQLTQEDFIFLESRHADWLTLSAGFVRNFDRNLKERFLAIYHKYISDDFILDYNCQVCLFDMMVRIQKLYLDAQSTPEITTPVVPAKKRTQNK